MVRSIAGALLAVAGDRMDAPGDPLHCWRAIAGPSLWSPHRPRGYASRASTTATATIRTPTGMPVKLQAVPRSLAATLFGPRLPSRRPMPGPSGGVLPNLQCLPRPRIPEIPALDPRTYLLVSADSPSTDKRTTTEGCAHCEHLDPVFEGNRSVIQLNGFARRAHPRVQIPPWALPGSGFGRCDQKRARSWLPWIEGGTLVPSTAASDTIANAWIQSKRNCLPGYSRESGGVLDNRGRVAARSQPTTP
jgi:hypothetical protein